MKVYFSKNEDNKNILKVKPETELESQLLLNFGSEGKWLIFPDADITMVIKGIND